MSKLIDEMAQELYDEIIKKDAVCETFTKQEVLMFCNSFLELVSKVISEWVEDFVKKQIWKIDKKKEG